METSERVLAQRRDPTIPSRRRNLAGVGWIVAGLVLGFPSPALIYGAMQVAKDRGAVGAVVVLTSALAAIVGLILATRWALVRGRKLLSADGATTLTRDPRAPVLLLRSFADDETRYRPSYFRSRLKRHPSFAAWLLGGYRTYEERLAHALRARAPVVTIGDPRDRLPALGADRVYVADAKWRAQVLELMERAQLVVLQVADTPSLIWEAEQAVRGVAPERLLLCVPVDTRHGERPLRERYEAFRQATTEIFPQPLPTDLGDAQFIAFAADWRPWRFVPASDSASTDSALWHLRNEFRPYPALRWVRVIGGASIVMAGILSVLAFWLVTWQQANSYASFGDSPRTPLVDPAPAWRTVALPGGAAAASMPAPARHDTVNRQTAIGLVRGRTAQAQYEDELYALIETRVPLAATDIAPRQGLRRSVQAAVGTLGMELTGVTTIGSRLRPGIAFVATGAPSRVAQGIGYLRGTRLYYAYAVTSRAAGALARADRFLRSFTLNRQR